MRYRSTVVVGILLFVVRAGAAPPRAEALLTQSSDFARVEPARWVAEPWRVDQADDSASVVAADDTVAFVVAGAQRAMAWTLTTEPIWTAPFRHLALSYFVEGVPEGDSGAFITLFDGSTGPITPGATNTENPLASGGRFTCGTFSPGLHVEVIDLFQAENLERIAEITVTVRSAQDPVAVRLNQLVFLADPAESTATLTLDPPDGTVFTALGLPAGGRVPLDAVARAFGFGGEPLPVLEGRLSGFPFTLSTESPVTPLNRGGAVVLTGPAQGDTLALICAARLWGSAEGWYAAGSAKPRTEAAGAHQFQVMVRYGDGSVAAAIPLRGDGTPGLVPGVGAYHVAIDPARTVDEVACVEEMSYGQVALLAASVLAGGAPEVADTTAGIPSAASAVPGAVDPAGMVDTRILNAGGMRMAVRPDGTVVSLTSDGGHPWSTEPFPLVRITGADGQDYPLVAVESLESPEQDRLVLQWQLGDTSHQLELSLEGQSEGGVRCAATLSNLGSEAWRPAEVRLPSLNLITISQGGPAAYMLGTRSAISGTGPVDVSEVYGGHFPLQFMDSYDAARGGGLACMVLDEHLDRKWFNFSQNESGRVSMSVAYRNLTLAPGERRGLAPVLLLPHSGDWREPFARYKAWAQQVFPRTRDNALADVFYCRRDYPLGGTTYLYDPAGPRYSFGKLISESRWAFGAVDMIDISGWAYNEDVGRVGTYRENDLGGLDALAIGARESDEAGVKVGLYFEGYLVDRRAAIAATADPAWQLIRADGKPAWWNGEMEFFCCPGAAGWQEQLAADIAAVALVTRANAVYVDQLGICDTGKECWSTAHGHPVPSNPIAEEIGLLKRVRSALDGVRPSCAIYIEHLPCDAMTPYIDGVFNMGMKHTRHALGPTKLPLHRYLTPEVPVFEMVAHGIRPIPAEADDLKLSFFHGMGLWLKGRGASWYSEGFRRLAPGFHEVLVDYGEFFRSSEAEPQVNTLREGVYANRFPVGNRVVYTLYNANPVTVSGAVLSVGPGAALETLYVPEPAKPAIADGVLTLADFFPQEVAAFLVTLPE